MADDMRSRMGARFLRPKVPERPAILPESDTELLSLLRQSFQTRPSDFVRSRAGIIGAWFNAIERAELEGAVRLDLLTWAWGLYDRALGKTEGDAIVLAGRQEVAQFIERNYGIERLPIVADIDPESANGRLVQWEAVREATRHWDLCPRALRVGEMPKKKRRMADEIDPLEAALAGALASKLPDEDDGGKKSKRSKKSQAAMEFGAPDEPVKR